MEIRARSPFIKSVQELWINYKRNKLAVFGLLAVLTFALIAVLAQQIAPYSPYEIGEEQFAPPSSLNLFGTDVIGRDIFSQIVYGTRTSLTVGLLAVVTSTIIGVIFGSFAGFYGGVVDELLMRITEFFMVIPKFFLAIVLVTIWGASILNLILVIGLLSWPIAARLIRAEFMTLKQKEFVLASKMIGESNLAIIFKDILPNTLPTIIVNSSLEVARAIWLEAGLSFLGLGDPTSMSWGYMLYTAKEVMRLGWWLSLFPGLAIFLSVLAFNFVGDGLNDAINPKLRLR